MEDVKPVKLAYISADPKDGARSDQPPIILHHGMTAYKEHWENVMQLLADETRRKVYSVDARNHGDSERSDEFSFQILHIDLEHFMDTLKIPKATIVGHSMGGAVAMVMALKRPERVENIIIEDMSPKDLNPELMGFFEKMMEMQIQCIKEIPADTDEETARKILAEAVFSKLPPFLENEMKNMKNFKFPIRRTESGYEWKTNIPVILKATYNKDLMKMPHSDTFHGDALFIYGTESFIRVQDDKDLILKLFPKAQFHEIADCGHDIHMAEQDEFMKAVLKFLRE